MGKISRGFQFSPKRCNRENSENLSHVKISPLQYPWCLLLLIMTLSSVYLCTSPTLRRFVSRLAMACAWDNWAARKRKTEDKHNAVWLLGFN